jgi:hypothetical protein
VPASVDHYHSRNGPVNGITVQYSTSLEIFAWRRQRLGQPKNTDAVPDGVQAKHALHHSRQVSPSVSKSAVGLWGTKMCGT